MTEDDGDVRSLSHKDCKDYNVWMWKTKKLQHTYHPHLFKWSRRHLLSSSSTFERTNCIFTGWGYFIMWDVDVIFCNFQLVNWAFLWGKKNIISWFQAWCSNTRLFSSICVVFYDAATLGPKWLCITELEDHLHSYGSIQTKIFSFMSYSFLS